MSDLNTEIEAFNEMKPFLLKYQEGDFVVFHNKKLVCSYDNFNDAAEEAVRRFGKGPYLIKEVLLEERRYRLPLPAMEKVERKFL